MNKNNGETACASIYYIARYHIPAKRIIRKTPHGTLFIHTYKMKTWKREKKKSEKKNGE
jgi:hypothetical protein